MDMHTKYFNSAEYMYNDLNIRVGTGVNLDVIAGSLHCCRSKPFSFFSIFMGG